MKFIRENRNLKGKTVLVRSDFDVPHAGAHGEKILNDYRIRQSLATIEFLHEKKAKVIIISKVGRPKKYGDPQQTLEPEARLLAQLLGKKIIIAEGDFPQGSGASSVIFYKGDIRHKENLEKIKAASPDDIIILEDIRYYPEEENLDAAFAKNLASVADIFVFDAMAMAHRREASTILLPKYLPAYCGLNVEKEIIALNKILTLRASPFVLLVGGAKISDKIDAVKKLGKQAQAILIGGGPANLIFGARGYEIGKSLYDKKEAEFARELLRNFKTKIFAPLDVVVAKPNKDFTEFKDVRVAAPEQVKKSEAILDIGPKTILAYSDHIKKAKKLAWSGPMGLFEFKTFSHGTMSLALLFANRCHKHAYGLIGGGDTLEAFGKAKVLDQVDFASTAGSAMLEYLGGTELPALAALEQSK